jgi:hypothetical protein
MAFQKYKLYIHMEISAQGSNELMEYFCVLRKLLRTLKYIVWDFI